MVKHSVVDEAGRSADAAEGAGEPNGGGAVRGDGATDLAAAFASFEETWSPRIGAVVNDYDVKIAKVEGAYVWHAHPDTDEFFLVLAGELTLELADRNSVVLGPQQMFTVERGLRHRPVAAPGTRILMFERQGTVNSGDAELTGDAAWVCATQGVPLGE
ncbi:cupin domain-containing protein [Streptomyces benahoarensis]|uniref:Cupin domain-containing protein n=1 Tax=Streptomyces benahoarensis TaxID=2595054 RepID=A0A553X5K6_9ACTN|nr:cupin domain-containing protein [Streptomyces benahoarensis]TSB05743.1 cupin domain-containing protein [Streptomyces benahoarensis]TSB12239.1 cupin domain-containing protein [Streptomyces benahoarensis]